MICLTYSSPRTSRRATRKDCLKVDTRFDEIYVHCYAHRGYYSVCLPCCAFSSSLRIKSNSRLEIIDTVTRIYNDIEVLHKPIKFIFDD